MKIKGTLVRHGKEFFAEIYLTPLALADQMTQKDIDEFLKWINLPKKDAQGGKG